jgi:hypothetical protein
MRYKSSAFFDFSKIFLFMVEKKIEVLLIYAENSAMSKVPQGLF